MSTINMILKNDAAYVVSDGAFVRPINSKVAGIGSKLIHMPQIPAVIVVRGNEFHIKLLEKIARRIGATSFSALKAVIIPAVRRAMARSILFQHVRFYQDILRIPLGADFDVGVAGWCDRNGPSSFFFTSAKIHPVKPWELFEPGDCFICPDTEQMSEKDFPDRTLADLPADGLRLLQCQRQLRVPGKSDKFCLVGGFASLTTIRYNSIKTDIIGKWPDKIGEVIKREAEPTAVGLGGFVGRLGR